MFRILDWNAFHNLKPLFNLETAPHAFFRRILIDCGIWISHLTVCLGEEFGAVIWGAAGIWGSGFINYPVWHHKFPISMWDLLLGFVTHKYHLKIPSKHRISDIHQARDFFFFLRDWGFYVSLFVSLLLFFLLFIFRFVSTIFWFQIRPLFPSLFIFSFLCWQKGFSERPRPWTSRSPSWQTTWFPTPTYFCLAKKKKKNSQHIFFISNSVSWPSIVTSNFLAKSKSLVCLGFTLFRSHPVRLISLFLTALKTEYRNIWSEKGNCLCFGTNKTEKRKDYYFATWVW